MSEAGNAVPADQQSVASSAAYPAPRRSAKHAAEMAARAAALAASLHEDTTKTVLAASLRDLKLPCVPVAPTAVVTETRRTVSADYVLPSPWCGEVAGPEYALPATATRDDVEAMLKKGLKVLSLGERPVDMKDATLLAEILSSTTPLQHLNLRRCIDAARAPPVPADMLQKEIDALEAQVGPEEDEATIEKLQAICEKNKIEFTGYEAALRSLALKKFDRITVLIGGLARNYTVSSIDLSQNALGAPNAEGRASYQTLRRLGVFIDNAKKLNVLDLSGNGMGPVGVGIVAKAMTKNITIHTLNLSGNDINGEAPDEEDDPENEEGDPVFGEVGQGLESLAELLKKNKFLKVLSLRYNRLKGEIEPEGEDDGVDTPLGKFLEPFKKYHRLEVLDLASNDLGDAGARMVSAALMENKSIRTLDVSDNGIGLIGFDWIAKLIAANSTLSTLHMQRNQIKWNRKSKKATKAAFEVFGRFAAALSANISLTDLNLGGHHFGVEVSAALLEGFDKSHVTTLNFESNNLCGEPDVAEPDTRALEKILAAVHRPNFPLKVLRLASNRLLVRGAQLVADCIIPNVEELDLGRNTIGDEGLNAVCKALVAEKNGRHAALRVLKLPYNGIRDITELAHSLPRIACIRTLDLSHNRVGSNPDAFRDFINGTGKGSLLHDLLLSSNALGTDRSHVDVLESLFRRSVAPLARVDLYDNPAISLDDTMRMVQSLAHNRGLRAIRISSQAGDRYALAEAAAKLLEVNKCIVDLDLCFGRDTDDDESLELIRTRLIDNALMGIDPSL